MTLSETLAAKFLAVTHLQYRLVVEIRNEDGDWIDFSGRDPRLPQLRQATQARRNQVISSIASVTLTNDDGYFDWMDDPANATTISTFGTLATKFTKGFRGKQVRLSIRATLPDSTYEDARLGTYRIRTIAVSKQSGRATLTLWQDVDFLRSMGTTSLTDGIRHHENKPVSYLIREILKRFYQGGVASTDFEIPGRIYLETPDGEPGFSHWGKPPEREASGRWRNDVTAKPTALMWSSVSSKFYVGIADELWSFNPATEVWALCGSFADDDFQIRGIYPIAASYCLVVGWKYAHDERAATLRTARLLPASDSMVTNDPMYDTLVYPGEFVLRDTINSGASGTAECYVGYIKNNPRVLLFDKLCGVNMPCPLPQWPHSGTGTTSTNKLIAKIAGGLRAAPAETDWTDIAATMDPHGIEISEPCYLAHTVIITGTSSIRPQLQASWGMAPNLAWASALADFSGSYLFVVETDGNPMGIRCTGYCRIVAYSSYTGSKFQVSENDQGGDLAPMYGLRFHSNGSDDYLYWIDVNWVEEQINVGGGGTPGDCDPPIWHIKRAQLTDDGAGKPELLDANRDTIWQAGYGTFAADDTEYAALMIIPVPAGAAASWFLVQALDMADMGGACFKLFACSINMGMLSDAVLLDESAEGWGGFVEASSKIYFVDRSTGRIMYVNKASKPSACHVVGDGSNPVDGAFYELPQAEGLVVRTELSKECLYGVSFPHLPGWVNEGLIWQAGKYYFWKFHPELTDRVELFEEDRQDAWEALGLLAEAVNHQVGIDPDGTGFFRPIPDGSGSVEFEIDLDSSIDRHITIEKADGLDEIVNRSQFVPYESTVGEPEATLDLGGYHHEGKQVYFNGETEVRSDSTIERNVTLHCIKGGAIGTALFKYLIHDFQISTALREDVNLGAPRQLRLDNNQDLEVGMLAQVGDWDVGAKIYEIQADGDVILDTDMTQAFDAGTQVIFRSAEHGKWSTEYDTPDDFTAETVFAEIGDTGLWLRFTESDGADAYNFAVGDRIRVYNPGLSLEKSRTKKYYVEDTDSIATYGASEYNPDNPYMSLTLGRALVAGLVTGEKAPHHDWKITCPLLLQARPHTLIRLRSREHLPTATDNEEVCFIRQVEHDLAKARTTITARACEAYR